jgi:hypothetical protein
LRIIPVLLILLAGVQAQERPNFSGAWVVTPERSVWYADGKPVNITVFGERFTAEQTDQALTVAIENERGFKWVYRLDGASSRNVLPGRDVPQETVSTAIWNDSTLIITTVGPVNRDGKVVQVETRRTLQLNADGTLRVEAPWGLNGAMIGSVYSRLR